MKSISQAIGGVSLPLLFALTFVFGCGGSSASRKSASRRGDSSQPTIQISGLTAQVSRDGKVSEQFQAEWARLDETDRILNLRNLSMEFFKDGDPLGQAHSGRGTLWMSDRPDQKIARNDLRLDQTVAFQSREGWLISSPRMDYRSLDAMLYSNDGYVKQWTSREGYILGRGQRFEMQLAPESGTFKTLNEYGNPLIYETSEQPAVKPMAREVGDSPAPSITATPLTHENSDHTAVKP